MDGARRHVLRGDDQPLRRAASRAGEPGAVLITAPGTRGAFVGRDREGAVPHGRRPPAGDGADALPRRPPLAVPVQPVGLSADLHLLRHRVDGLRAQPHGVGDPRSGTSLPPQGAGRSRGVHGDGRAAAEPRRGAGGVRATALDRHPSLLHDDLDRRLDPGHRPPGRTRWPDDQAGALPARPRRRAALRADARERALPAGGRPGRLPALARAAPPEGVRGVPDAGRGERPLRAGAAACRAAPAPQRVQGEPDPLQPDGLRPRGLKQGGDRRFPARARRQPASPPPSA